MNSSIANVSGDTWRKLLDTFQRKVSNGIYNKIDYKIWRDLQHFAYSNKVTIFYYWSNDVYEIYDTDNFDGQHTFLYGASDSAEDFKTFLAGRLSFEPRKTASNVNIEKEKDEMKFNFDFGPVDSNTVRMSMYGLAVKNINGVWVSYDSNGNQVVDVDIFNCDGSQFMYKMPVAVKDIKAGDVIVHAKRPMFVLEVSPASVKAVDVYEGEVKNVIPTTNMFGFNFVTKIVSFLNFGTPTADSPFGNMWPLMLLSDNKTSDNKAMLMAMLMGGGNVNFADNPALFMLLADGAQDNSNMLLAMMAAQNGGFGNTHKCNCGNCDHKGE